MQVYTEKRDVQRIKVQIPVQLAQGVGTTRDVSQTGVYFITDQNIEPDSTLDFSLELDYALPGKSMRLNCRGHVVRVETLNGKLGVAASINDVSYAA